MSTIITITIIIVMTTALMGLFLAKGKTQLLCALALWGCYLGAPEPELTPLGENVAKIQFWQEVIPQNVVGCQVAVHYKVTNTLQVNPSEVDLWDREGVCLWETKEELQAIIMYGAEHLFIGAHGELNEEDRDSFAGGIEYDWVRTHKRPEQVVGVFSCRTDPNNPEDVESYVPHLEDGLWVWGRKGATLWSDMLLGAQNFFAVAN
jgi:hypothetical protein